jgi:tRNA (guanine37-N1)-methyltransferase
LTSRETTTAKRQVERPSFTVPRSAAELAIQSLAKTGILDRYFAVKTRDRTIILPLSRKLTEAEIEDLQKLVPNSNLGTEDFEPRISHPRTLEAALADWIPSDLMSKLPRSFDVVGDITVLELGSELAAYETSIAEAIIQVHPNVRAVFAKSGEVSGAERVRPLRHIAGESRTLTIHKEHGCSFKVDLSKVFFSPRLSTEHLRIAGMVDKGERVVDMFAGVGPFSILIAKRLDDVRVEAIDANPQAIELIRTNVRANKVESKVYAHLGDARDIIRESLAHRASRIIMNHPSASKDFIKDACKALQPSGGIIHYYTFTSENWEADSRSEVEDGVETTDYVTERVLGIRKVREVAPMKWQVAVDLRVHPRR